MLELGLPRSPRFLINTVILTMLLFGSYYGLFSYKSENSLHKNLTEAYYKGFWQEPRRDSSVDVSLQIVWPQYVSSLVEREIVVSLTNNTTDDIEPIVVISAIFSEPTSDDGPLQQWLIWQTESQFGSNRYNGRSILNLGTIPPEGQITESVWVRVAPVGNAPDRIPFDAYVQWTHPNNPDRACETEEKTGARGEICTLRVAPAPQATVSTLQTIWQGIVRILLLPPLTNLFLPLLALFLSLTFEGLRTAIINDLRKFGSKSGNNKSINASLWSRIKGKGVILIEEQGFVLGGLGLIFLMFYAIALLWLIIESVVALLLNTQLSGINVILKVVFVVFTLIIVIYLQKQQKSDGPELTHDSGLKLAEALEVPLPVSIVQQDKALSDRVETIQDDLQKLNDFQTFVHNNHVSREELSRWQEFTDLKERVDKYGSERRSCTELQAEIVELQENLKIVQERSLGREVVTGLESSIAELKGYLAEGDIQTVKDKVDKLNKRLAGKVNRATYNDHKKMAQDFRKVFELILIIEQMQKLSPDRPEDAKPYWEQLNKILLSSKTHPEVKKEYQGRHDDLQRWFASDKEPGN